jgi:hypothetical protein
MNQLHCSNCNVSLSGGLDTFGPVGEELCHSCFLSPMPETESSIILDDYEASLDLEPQIMQLYQQLHDKNTPAA